jgi:hypothetical protein
MLILPSRKSQIAIEYAYRIKESAPRTWVFWVHASNPARFKQAYRDIAAKVELPGRDDPKVEILGLVHSWLCDERNGQWLMVVDNADDNQVFYSSNIDSSSVAQGALEVAPLANFLPQSANGCILVTSRDLVAAVNLVGAKHNVIQVEPMGDQDALALLMSKVQVDEPSKEDARALIKTLEGIPLAITHAAAYIAVREPRVTISTYLELFRESEANQTYLLNSQEARDIRRDASVSDAVITTWQISFEQIQNTRREAAELLSLMAMFDRQGVPEHLLYEGRTKLQFEEAVAPLCSFSLVKTQIGKQSAQQLGWQLFEMHSLVQLATKKWLALHCQVHMWQKASLRIMAAAFPGGRPETWTVCRALLPHARKLLDYSTKENEARLHQATVANSTAWYLVHMGEYVTAESIGRRAMITREELLGPEHTDTLISVSHLGSVLESQGKYEEAEAMHRRDLEGSEKVLGPEHPNTLTSVSQLGSVLSRQGKYEEAEAMHRRALRAREEVLGPEHPDTLTSVSQLGSVLSRQGKYEEAEAMHRRALRGYEKVLGPDHPDTLTSVYYLAHLVSNQHGYNESLALYERAYAGYCTVLGRDHPTTRACLQHYTEAKVYATEEQGFGESVFLRD